MRLLFPLLFSMLLFAACSSEISKAPLGFKKNGTYPVKYNWYFAGVYDSNVTYGKVKVERNSDVLRFAYFVDSVATKNAPTMKHQGQAQNSYAFNIKDGKFEYLSENKVKLRFKDRLVLPYEGYDYSIYRFELGEEGSSAYTVMLFSPEFGMLATRPEIHRKTISLVDMGDPKSEGFLTYLQRALIEYPNRYL